MKNNLKIVYTILAILVVIIAIIFGIKEMIGQMGIMIIFFLTFIVFGNLDKFVSFKISKDGLEAKMKELDDSIKYTQDIAIFLASTELSTLSRSGRWGGISNVEKEKIKKELVEKLKDIKISNEIIEDEVLKYWHEFTILDYYTRIYNRVYSLIRNVPFGQVKEEFKEFEEKFKFNTQDYFVNIKKFNALKDFIKKYSIEDEELNYRIEDYEYYFERKTHRSMDRWLKEE